jgi:hypothetical protein
MDLPTQQSGNLILATALLCNPALYGPSNQKMEPSQGVSKSTGGNDRSPKLPLGSTNALRHIGRAKTEDASEASAVPHARKSKRDQCTLWHRP